MATIAASFQSSLRDTEQAVRAALTEILPTFSGAPPQFGFILAASRHPLAKVLSAARAVLPETEFIVSWAVNGFTQAATTQDGIVGMLFSSNDMLHVTSVAGRISDDIPGAAKALVRDFASGEELGKKRGLSKSATLMFVDGLSASREGLIDEVRKGCRPFKPIVGAAVTDDGTFQFCQIGTTKSGVMRDSAALFHVFSKQNFSIGVSHNHKPTTTPMVATKVSGVVLHTIDGEPAFEVYRRHAKERGVVLTHENLRPYLIQYPLGLYFFDDLTRLRTAFAALPDGSLICGGNIPEGAKICILGASKSDLIAAAGAAAEAAKAGLSSPAAGVMVFSCFGRSQTLKDHQAEEIQAIRKVFPTTPMVGFSSYGEIARYKGALDGYHNSTVVVVAVPA